MTQQIAAQWRGRGRPKATGYDNWHRTIEAQRERALARWEDDGGRVIDRAVATPTRSRYGQASVFDPVLV